MGIGAMGVTHPQLVMRNIIPVVMAGVLGIYGLIVSVILLGSSESHGFGVLFPAIVFFVFFLRMLVLCTYPRHTKRVDVVNGGNTLSFPCPST